VTTEVQHDLDKLGIAKNAREEKIRARDAKLKQAEHEKMMKLYREHVLKEQPLDLVQIDGIGAAPAKAEEREEVGSFGD
jgi:tetraether lipid synthase